MTRTLATGQKRNTLKDAGKKMNPEAIIDPKALVSFLILVGAVVIARSFYSFRKIVNDENPIFFVGSARNRFLFHLYMGMMVFFLIGYSGVLCSVLTGVELTGNHLVALIFFLGAVFIYLGVTIQSRMLQTLRETFTRAIRMLIATVEVRDPYTIGHSEHVANLAVMIFDHLPEEARAGIDRGMLGITGLLHDIGKIGVPEAVLNKMGRPDLEEWDMIRQHVSIGRSLLKKLEGIGAVTEWVLYHHERIDGKGYLGMGADEIPPASKIIAVADTFSALVTDRPYRKGKSNREAMEILLNCIGTQLDGTIVETLCSIEGRLIDNCRPEALLLDYLDEIKRLNEHVSSKTGDTGFAGGVVSWDAGLIFLGKIIEFSRENRFHTTVCTLTIKNLHEIDRDFGYHEADEVSSAFENLFVNFIRDTDIAIKCQRDQFILVFPKCSAGDSMKLVDRILRGFDPGSRDGQKYSVGISREFTSYDPDDEGSAEKMKKFVGDLSDRGPGLF